MLAACASPQVAELLNERYKVGDELKRSIRDDILRLIEAKTYRCVGAFAVKHGRLQQPREAA
jgi:ribosomal protein S13